MLRAISLLSFVVLFIVGIYLYTDKMSNNIEQDIMTSVHTAISDSGLLNNKDTNIFITVNGRYVTLNGRAPSTEIRSYIEDTARSVFGVEELTSKISIVTAKEDNKKGMSLSEALSPNKEETEEGSNSINNPVVLNIIACDPAVCAKAIKKQKTAPKTEGNVK